MSVILNITISIYFFSDIGFIIIPIATTIASWFNTLLLIIYVYSKKYFFLNNNTIKVFFRIILTNLIVIYIYSQLISYFGNYLDFDSDYKLLTILLIVVFTFIIYILISILTKAFKISDIKLKY